MHARPILDNCVQLLHTGRAQHDFSPKQWGDTKNAVSMLAKRLLPISDVLEAQYMFAPRLAFTRTWLEATDYNVQWNLGDKQQPWGNPEQSTFLIRSREPADGGILPADPDPDTIIGRGALCGFNADCPFGVILWPDGRLGFCHLGLECLLPKDGSPSILETGGLEPGCKVHLTAGIRPCCYGRNDGGFEYAFERFPEAQGGTATKGPRKEQPSLDLHQLARSILAKMDLTDVTWDSLCTACAATPDGKRLYYSNVYGNVGRNCVAVKRIAL